MAWYGRVAGVVEDALARLREVENERRVLRQFQQRLLDIDHRSTAGIIAAYYRPAERNLLVGGDWYDVVTLDDGSMGISIGDVVGNGLTAATTMAQLRSAIMAAATTTRGSPAPSPPAPIYLSTNCARAFSTGWRHRTVTLTTWPC